MNNYKKPPKPSEFEFSLLGRGNSYGESIVIHLGNNKWAIIDTFINTKTKQHQAIDYLKGLNVDITKDVEFILATHWHQDHTTQIKTLVEQCTNAKIYMSAALSSKEFAHLIAFTPKMNSNFNPSRPFKELINYLVKSKRKFSRVRQNQLLYRGKIVNNHMLQFFALAPNEEMIQYFAKSIKQLLKYLDKTINRITRKPCPNLASVVSCIEIGDFTVLLGADLEISTHNDVGWNGVKQSQILKDKKVDVFKIPHHGSKTGYDPDWWKQILKEDNYLTINPLVKGKTTKLPSQKMLKNICSFSQNTYLTADPEHLEFIKHKGKIGKFIESTGLKIVKPDSSFRQIRIRKDFTSIENLLTVELFGTACGVQQIQ